MSEKSDKSIRNIAEQAAEELEKLESGEEQTRRSFMGWVTTSPQHIEEALTMAELNATLTNVLQREWANRSMADSSAPPKSSGLRVIRKYDKRLYDTVETRTTTHSDIRKLIVDRIDFVVIDRRTQEDVTCATLFQVIAEQEHGAEPLMSREFLAEIIRAHGTSRESLRSYLEHSLKLFTAQQVDAHDLVATAAEHHFGNPRVIRRYPNRKLYDTVESRYITVSDIRRMLIEHIHFVVIDKSSQEDTTRAILLRVVAEREHDAEPIMSRDFLMEAIRCGELTSRGMLRSYLEETLKRFGSQQRGVAGEGGSPGLADTAVAACNNLAVSHLALRNYQRWRQVQDEIYRTLVNAGRGGRVHEDPHPDRPPRVKRHLARRD